MSRYERNVVELLQGMIRTYEELKACYKDYNNETRLNRSTDPSLHLPPSDLTETSGLGDASNNARSNSGRSNVLALEVGNEVGRANAVEATRAAESVDLASTAQARRAGRATVAGSEDLAAAGTCINRVRDVLEDVAFGDDGGAGADLEGMARVRVPVVVDLDSISKEWVGKLMEGVKLTACKSVFPPTLGLRPLVW